ncbi:MAG: cupin domain-containing protein [Candidatus Sedimenticola endophacoides]
MTIHCEHRASPAKLEILGVFDWPLWEKEASEFPWHYDREETCYFLRGKVIVTPEGGPPLEFGRGDLVTFPAGMDCTWKILQPVIKHYAFN